MTTPQLKTGGSAAPAGTTHVQVTRDLGILTARTAPSTIQRPTLGWFMRNWLQYRRRDLPKLAAARFVGLLPGLLCVEAQLHGAVYRRPEGLATDTLQRLQALLAANVPVHELAAAFGGVVTPYGVLSTRVVTDAGVAYIVDAFQNLTELENMKYHGYGTGTTAEGASQTALVTELTTEYATDNVRPTGSQTETSANIYSTVGTLTPNAGGTIAVTEHAIFSQAAVAGGTMLDRSVFSAVNIVASSDSLQTTYNLTLTSGS